MADRVDAAMQRVKDPARDPAIDRVPAQSQRQQLGSRHDAVLAVRPLGDLHAESRHRFAAHFAVK